MKEEHFVGKVAQKAIIVKDGKALITLDVSDIDVWGLPGGRLNVGEKPQEGLEREIREELGVEVVVGPIIYLETFIHSKNNDQHLFLMYSATLKDENQSFSPDATEAAEIKWIDAESLDDQKMFETYKRALQILFKITI